jgi:hypothetical protein
VVFYAIAMALEIIWGRQSNGLLLLPALFWIGAVLHLLPEETTWRSPAIRVWLLAAIPLLILTLLNPWFSVIAIVALLSCVILITTLRAHTRFKNTFAVLIVIGLFFTLSTGLLILPLNWLPRDWMMPALGLDLILLGVAITVWDAFDEGELLGTHMLRSLVSSLYYAGALATLVILAVAIDGELSPGKLVALVLVIAFGILTQVFSNPIQFLLDQLTLSSQSSLSNQRDLLRQSADALARRSTLNPADMDEEEFARLTRRAISHLADLPKLTASPLTNLAGINIPDGANPLDRAHALKSLLIESIQRLKPQGKADFGTTDEWRYYNSLYFPYVLGLKPYARRADKASLDETSRQALEWFQSLVPERTLHNWQNAAARLIANELKSKK